MYLEWPVFRRCCFCLPLRRGILILAYFDLVIGALEYGLPLLGAPLVFSLHREYLELPVQLTISLFVLDKMATILLIFGLHTNRTLLIRIYFYFLIISLLSSVLLIIIDISVMTHIEHMIYSAMIYVFMTVCSIYILLLVRSLLVKLQESDGSSFGNPLADMITTTDGHSRIVSTGIA